MGKILHFSACRGEEYFTAPHNTSRRGGFSFIPVPSRPQARQNSPCSAPSAPRRDRIRPAPPKLPKISAFSPAGRVFSRRWVPQPPHSTCRPPHLKPITPMRVDHCHEMKPLTPLLAQNSQIQAIFRPQRCHGFHAPLAEHPQRRCRLHPRQALRPQPKPRVACAHATRPVAHWPHD